MMPSLRTGLRWRVVKRGRVILCPTEQSLLLRLSHQSIRLAGEGALANVKFAAYVFHGPVDWLHVVAQQSSFRVAGYIIIVPLTVLLCLGLKCPLESVSLRLVPSIYCRSL